MISLQVNFLNKPNNANEDQDSLALPLTQFYISIDLRDSSYLQLCFGILEAVSIASCKIKVAQEQNLTDRHPIFNYP